MMQEDKEHLNLTDQGLASHTKVYELYSVVHGKSMQDMAINY